MTVQEMINELSKVKNKSHRVMIEKIKDGEEEVYEGQFGVTLYVKHVSTIFTDGTLSEQ